MIVAPPALVYPVTLFLQLVNLAFTRAGRPRLTVTSWGRTDARASELADQRLGVARSLHVKFLAMDLQGTGQARQAMGTAWRALGLDAVDEPGGVPGRINPVLHIELDGPALRRLGVDFR